MPPCRIDCLLFGCPPFQDSNPHLEADGGAKRDLAVAEGLDARDAVLPLAGRSRDSPPPVGKVGGVGLEAGPPHGIRLRAHVRPANGPAHEPFDPIGIEPSVGRCHGARLLDFAHGGRAGRRERRYSRAKHKRLPLKSRRVGVVLAVANRHGWPHTSQHRHGKAFATLRFAVISVMQITARGRRRPRPLALANGSVQTVSAIPAGPLEVVVSVDCRRRPALP